MILPARRRAKRGALAYLPVVLASAACAAPDSPPDTAAAAPATADSFVTMPDGARLHVRRVGSGGTPVLLVPGLFLLPEFERIAEGRTLIFIDPRNRGRSDTVADSTLLTIEQDVADLEVVRAQLGAPRVDLVGYSYAGMLVALYAARHPERVRRIVQLGPVPRRFDTPFPAQLTATEPAEVTAAIAALDTLPDDYATTHPREYCELAWRASRARLVGDPANVERLGAGRCAHENEWPVNLARHLRHHFGSVQRLDFAEERVRAIRAPVLTIHGTLDRNAPYGAGREWALTLPEARLLTVPGAAHQSWVDAPEPIFRAIDTFLDGAWPEDAERITTLLPDTTGSS